MQIRKKIFETNSSSTHSIVVDSGIDYVTPEIEGEEIIIKGGGYGWGYEKLDTWRGRASYAYTYAKNYGKKMDLENLRLVIEDYTKKKVVFVDEMDDTYIDHQSIKEAETIFGNYDRIKSVIFGKDSYIIIDNDNH